MPDALFDTERFVEEPEVDPDPHYFSNGEEHRMWEQYWCHGCIKDHSTHRGVPDYDNACPVIAAAMAHLPVEGWVLDNRYITNPIMRVRCNYYAPCSCKDGVWKR